MVHHFVLFGETVGNAGIYEVICERGITMALAAWIGKIAYAFHAIAVKCVRHACIKSKVAVLEGYAWFSRNDVARTTEAPRATDEIFGRNTFGAHAQ